MKPLEQNLEIEPGTSYKDTIRFMQPTPQFIPIMRIESTPAVLTLFNDFPIPLSPSISWPVYIHEVVSMPFLNSKNLQQPYMLSAPEGQPCIPVSCRNLIAVGNTNSDPIGILEYRLPVDISTADFEWKFYKEGKLILTVDSYEAPLGARVLESISEGTLIRFLSPAQTALLTGSWEYTFDVLFDDGTITRYFRGGPAQ